GTGKDALLRMNRDEPTIRVQLDRVRVIPQESRTLACVASGGDFISPSRPHISPGSPRIRQRDDPGRQESIRASLKAQRWKFGQDICRYQRSEGDGVGAAQLRARKQRR